MSLLLPIGAKSHSLLQGELSSSSGSNHVDSMSGDTDTSRDFPQSYPSCFGLPYQDHNYGAPPPPTPPMSPPTPTTTIGPKVNGHIDIDDVSCHTTIETTAEDDDVVQPEDSVTRCICEFQHDDGYMICCDKCGVWQHVDCMAVDRLNIPEIYYCEKCEPRKVDKHRAIQLQTKRRELIIRRDSSATDTEDETPQGKKKKKDKAKQHKIKGNKKDKKDNNKIIFKPKVKLLGKHPKDKLKEQRRPDLSPLIINKKKNQSSLFSPKKKKLKSPRSVSLDGTHEELLKDSWSPEVNILHNGMLSPNTTRDPTGHVEDNQYSIDIETLLVSNRLNGGLSTRDVQPSGAQLQVRLCAVTQINGITKGLEATEDIATNQLIVEFRGMVMLKSQYLKEHNFYVTRNAEVLFYTSDSLELCIDSSSYNCDAKYIRRSCVSNAEVRHFVENENVRFFIYSSRCITKGAELTIPFDYNYKDCMYHVTCACSRQSCPVAKHSKNEDSRTPTKLVRKRRRRSTKSEEASSPVSNNVETVPALVHATKAKSPVQLPKRKKTSSISESTPAAGQPEIKLSPPRTRHSTDSNSGSRDMKLTERCSIDSKQDKSDSDHQDDQSTSHDEHKRAMSREERKMEAIMKAIEKMEKREERRREALSRIDPCRKSIDKPENNRTEKHQEETTEEDIKPEKERLRMFNRKFKGKKKKIGTPARRQSRASSSISVAVDSGTSADESCSSRIPSTPVSDISTSQTPSSAAADRAFRFPKTKKHRLSEWLQETGQEVKPLSIRTDLSDIDSEEAEFVKCVPSPHANSFSHLRRNSLQNRGDCHGKAVGSVNLQSDNIGSAKKRWLRQAMFETGPITDASLSPVNAGSSSPGQNQASNISPNTSPLDFVTPLKKRRLARESVSESPFTCPTAGMSPGPAVEINETSSDKLLNIEETDEKVSENVNNGLDFRTFKNGLHPKYSQKESLIDDTGGRKSQESIYSSIDEDQQSPSPRLRHRKSELPSSAIQATDSGSPGVSETKCDLKPDVKPEFCDQNNIDEESSAQMREDMIKDEDFDRIKDEDSDRIKDEDSDRIKDEDSDRIKDEDSDRIKDEDSDRIKDEDSDRIKDEDSDGSDTEDEDVDVGIELAPSERTERPDWALDEVERDDECNMVASSRPNSRITRSQIVDSMPSSSSVVQISADCWTPSSSSDPQSNSEQLNCSDCSSLQSEHNSNIVNLITNSARDLKADSSEVSFVDSSFQNRPQSGLYSRSYGTTRQSNVDSSGLGVRPYSSSLCVNRPHDLECTTKLLPREECDSTNREVGFDSLSRSEHYIDSPSCSSSVLERRTDDYARPQAELSSSSDLPISDSLRSADASSNLNGMVVTEGSCDTPSSSHNTSTDQIQCSSTNGIDTISDSNELAPSQAQDSIVSVTSALDSTGPDPCSSMNQLDPCSSGIHSNEQDDEPSPLDTSNTEVDSTEIGLCQASSSRREDGELDSSMSDIERDTKANSRIVSSSRIVQVDSDLMDISEKEEGEITDDDPEDSIDNRTVAVESVSIVTTSVVNSTSETASTSTQKSSESTQSVSPSSSSTSFKLSSTLRDRRDLDWGTPYRGNNSISSSSSSTSATRRERYSVDSHYRLNRNGRSSDRSPLRDDSQLVDSSSSERLRHHSDDSGHGLDNNISSTASDNIDENWRNDGDASPGAMINDNTSPISSTQPAKRKMSLTEYKKRMKQKRPEPARTTNSSGHSSASTSGRTTPVAKDSNQDLITPLMPYFGILGSSIKKDKGVLPAIALPSLKDPKEETDVQWNASATMAERIREQTQLSLTERLRREFGLDASESEEDDDRKTDEEDSDPPPPPPPVVLSSAPQTSYSLSQPPPSSPQTRTNVALNARTPALQLPLIQPRIHQPNINHKSQAIPMPPPQNMAIPPPGIPPPLPPVSYQSNAPSQGLCVARPGIPQPQGVCPGIPSMVIPPLGIPAPGIPNSQGLPPPQAMVPQQGLLPQANHSQQGIPPQLGNPMAQGNPMVQGNPMLQGNAMAQGNPMLQGMPPHQMCRPPVSQTMMVMMPNQRPPFPQQMHSPRPNSLPPGPPPRPLTTPEQYHYQPNHPPPPLLDNQPSSSGQPDGDIPPLMSISSYPTKPFNDRIFRETPGAVTSTSNTSHGAGPYPATFNTRPMSANQSRLPYTPESTSYSNDAD